MAGDAHASGLRLNDNFTSLAILALGMNERIRQHLLVFVTFRWTTTATITVDRLGDFSS